jgi:hypothetical protein
MKASGTMKTHLTADQKTCLKLMNVVLGIKELLLIFMVVIMTL